MNNKKYLKVYFEIFFIYAKLTLLSHNSGFILFLLQGIGII